MTLVSKHSTNTTGNNPCAGLGYDCNQPLPRSALNETGTLCPSLAEYLYDPANCDPGYWCGCSSTDASNCLPSNNTSTTFWGGRFTTTDLTTGEEIVLTGHFSNNNNASSAECPPHYYCPGLNDVNRCVDLCARGMVCGTPASMEECPNGSFCPVATVDPLPCINLEDCTTKGQRRFKVKTANIVILIILILSIANLFLGNFLLKRRARKTKQAKIAAKKETESLIVKTPSESLAELPDEQEVGDLPADLKKFASVEFSEVNLEEQSRPSQILLTPPAFTIDIECERLQLSLPGVGTIMHGVSGNLPHGKLTAIMGPSGCGKTTFLSLMSGKQDRTGGSLKVNGQETELTRFRNEIGFVPQEDVMLRELSVEEIVTHSALMRLPADMPHRQKMARVDQVLEALEINHIRDAVVGDEKKRGISGGQRKRVNCAMELVANPSLICLDEPTSGLDSTTASSMVQTLKNIANSGANVITVLHQPKYEVFELFDQVLLLGQGGMTVYYGSTTGMADYFETRGFPCPDKSNPADFYMDVLSGNVDHATDPDFDTDDLFVAWMCAEENADAVSPEKAAEVMEEIKKQRSAEETEKKRLTNSGRLARFCTVLKRHCTGLAAHLIRDFRRGATTRKTPGRFQQTRLLLKRAAIQRLRAPWSTVLNIVLMAIAGAILPFLVPSDATLYVGIPNTVDEENIGYEAYLRQNVKPVDQIPSILMNIYFFLLIVSCLSVNVLGPERTTFFRETATGQIVVSYWLAKTLEVLLWLPIYAVAFLLLGYRSDAWLLQPMGRLYVFVLLVLVGFYGFGMLASLLVSTGSAALLALVFGTIATVGFSGTVNAYGDASNPGKTFINAWFLFWSTQGIASEEYDQYRYAFDVERLNDETPNKESSDFGIGKQAVGAGKGMGYDLDSSYARNVAWALITAIAWHLLVLWTLKTKDHKKQR